MTDGEVDDPDLALRLGEGLQESTAGEITTVTHSAADANIYRWGHCLRNWRCSGLLYSVVAGSI